MTRAGVGGGVKRVPRLPGSALSTARLVLARLVLACLVPAACLAAAAFADAGRVGAGRAGAVAASFRGRFAAGAWAGVRGVAEDSRAGALEGDVRGARAGPVAGMVGDLTPGDLTRADFAPPRRVGNGVAVGRAAAADLAAGRPAAAP